MYIPAVKSYAECWNTEKPSLNILNLISNPLQQDFFNDFLNEASWSVGGTSPPFNFRKTPAIQNIILKTTNRVYFNFTPTQSMSILWNYEKYEIEQSYTFMFLFNLCNI